MEIPGVILCFREEKFLSRTATTANTTGWSMMASVSGAQLPVVGIHAQTVLQVVGRICQKYRHHGKGAPKCHWGSRMLKRLVDKGRSNSKRVSPGQQQLPFGFDCRLNQIPEEWHQVAVRFRRANGIRDGDRERSIW